MKNFSRMKLALLGTVASVFTAGSAFAAPVTLNNGAVIDNTSIVADVGSSGAFVIGIVLAVISVVIVVRLIKKA